MTNDEPTTMREQIEGLIADLREEYEMLKRMTEWSKATAYESIIDRLRAILDSEN